MGRIDLSIRIFLCILIFWLPYSPAVVEVCVVVSLVLWVIKRSALLISKLKSCPENQWTIIVRGFRPQPTFLDLPIACFLVTALLSIGGSFYFDESIHGFLTKTIEWFVVYYLVAEVASERKHIEVFLRVFLFTSLFVGLDALAQFFWTKSDFFLGRELTRGGATAAFKHANLLGGYSALVVPVSSAMAFAYRNKFLKSALFAVTAVAMLSLGVSFSRGAWLGLLSGALFVAGLSHRKFVLWGCIGLLTLGAVFSMIPFKEGKSVLRVTKANITDTMSWRWGVWMDSLKMIADKPAFGHGVNTYMKLFQEYRRKHNGYADYSPTYAHNCYVQLTAETGLLGLIAFLWIFLRLIKKCIAQLRELGQNKPSTILNMGLLTSVAVFLVHSAFDTNLYSLQLSILFWFFVGLLAALIRVPLPSTPFLKEGL